MGHNLIIYLEWYFFDDGQYFAHISSCPASGEILNNRDQRTRSRPTWGLTSEVTGSTGDRILTGHIQKVMFGPYMTPPKAAGARLREPPKDILLLIY